MHDFKELAITIAHQRNTIERELSSLVDKVELLKISFINLDDYDDFPARLSIDHIIKSSVDLAKCSPKYMSDLHLMSDLLQSQYGAYKSDINFPEQAINALLTCKVFLNYWSNNDEFFGFDALPVNMLSSASKFLEHNTIYDQYAEDFDPLTYRSPHEQHVEAIDPFDNNYELAFPETSKCNKTVVLDLMNKLSCVLIKKAHKDCLSFIISKKHKSFFLTDHRNEHSKLHNVISTTFKNNKNFFTPPKFPEFGVGRAVRMMDIDDLNVHQPFSENFAMHVSGLHAKNLLTIDDIIDGDNKLIKNPKAFFDSSEESKQLLLLALHSEFTNLTEENRGFLQNVVELCSDQRPVIQESILEEMNKVSTEITPDSIQSVLDTHRKGVYSSAGLSFS